MAPDLGPSRSTAWLGLFALVLLVSASPGAARVQGSMTLDLDSLEHAEVDVMATVADEPARGLRERADRDDDGRVEALEADGAALVLEDELQGPTQAYTLDARSSTNEDVDVELADLEGPTDRGGAIEATIEVDVRLAPAGEGNHTLMIVDPFPSVAPNASLGLRVKAPEGSVIAKASGPVETSRCQAHAPPGSPNATVVLSPEQGACPDPIPAWEVPTVVAAVLAAVGVQARWRSEG